MTRSASAPMELAAAAARDWRLLFVVDGDFLAAAMAAFFFFFASLAALALFFFVDMVEEKVEIR